MKKNISINISGIVFYIEEDGYQQLKHYLETISNYFTRFEDSQEIIEDIEYRIAEIFSTKLKAEKQVITITDIEELMSQMGSVADFEAAEEEIGIHQFQEATAGATDFETQEEKFAPTQAAFEYESTEENPFTEDKQSYHRLFRDTKRALLGGVAAGIAHFFKIDPLWMRLAFVALTIGGGAIFDAAPAITFLAYFALWFVVPKNEALEEQENLKRLFRDPENRVLGGVCGGLGAYLGIDPTWMRLIFIAGLFLGGSTFLVYLVFWFITPVAKTLTERMQMQGEPINLENIEATIKDSLNMEDKEGEENIFIRILLFPFRLLALLIANLGPSLQPLFKFSVAALRILSGSILLFISVVGIVVMVISLVGVHIGWEKVYFFGLKAALLRESLHFFVPLSILVFLDGILFFGFFGLLALLLLTKKSPVRAGTFWSLVGIWVSSLVATTVLMSFTGKDFREYAYAETNQTFNFQKEQMFYISLQPSEGNIDPKLRIRGYEGTEVRLVQEFGSYGQSQEAAITQAKEHQYLVFQKDSLLLFDEKLNLENNAYRGQELKMILYVPYNQPFKIMPNMASILRNTLSPYGFGVEDLEKHYWIFTATGLICGDCSREENAKASKRSLAKGEFTALTVNGPFDVEIVGGSESNIRIENDKTDFVDIEINEAGELIINPTTDLKKGELPKIYITVSELKNITLNAAAQGTASNLNLENISINLAGAAELEITGSGENLEAQIHGAGFLRAFDFKVENANLMVTGASAAEVNVSENIEAKVYGASKVVYEGIPENISKDVLGASSFRKR